MFRKRSTEDKRAQGFQDEEVKTGTAAAVSAVRAAKTHCELGKYCRTVTQVRFNMDPDHSVDGASSARTGSYTKPTRTSSAS